jgi:NADPH-dependent glutamate synthase beta subunit-like oxidoreductase
LCRIGVDRQRCQFRHAVDLQVTALPQHSSFCWSSTGPDQPRDAGVIGEEADDISPALHFLVSSRARPGFM